MNTAAARRPPPPPRAPATAQSQAPARPSGGGSMIGDMVGTMAQGFAFGTGSAVAHRAVGSVFGAFSGSSEGQQAQAPAPVQEQQPMFQAPAQAAACSVDQQNFIQCLQENNNNAASCQFFFEALQNCQANQQFA